MAARTDTFVAQEWTYIDGFRENVNYYATNPIEISCFWGMQPLTVGIVKFNIPQEIRKRKIKKITIEFPYEVVLFYGQGSTPQTGFGTTIYYFDALGSIYQESPPDEVNLRELTWADYEARYNDSLKYFQNSIGGSIGIGPINEYINGKKGTLIKDIWSDEWVEIGHPYDKNMFLLFKYNCLMFYTDSSITKITPSGIKLTFYTEDPSGNFLTTLKSPSSGFLRRDQENLFSWELGSVDYVYFPMVQKNATLYWKESTGSSWNEISISGSDTFYKIPKNTFPKSKITWKITVTAENGLTSSSEEQSFTTIDAISTAKAIYPKSIIIDNNKDVVFSWDHIIGTGTEQTKAELEYKESDGEWTSLATVEGSEKSVLIKAGTFPAGKILWRVRTYNMDSTAGNWSQEEEIVSRGSSPAPDPVTANTSPRVLVEWQSEGQISAEVRIRGIVYKVYGNAKKFKCPVYLSDGEALVEVRVLNEFDLWSEWGSTITVIKNADIPRIEVNYTIENYGVSMTWNTSGVSAYIYRDGVLIAKTTSNKYIDYESVGQHEYYIMVGNTEGYYAYSEPFIVDVKVPFALLSKRYTGEWIVLDKKRGDFPSHKINSKVNTTYQFYAGRKLPVAYQSDNLTRVHSLDFSFRKRGSSEKVAALSGEEVVYKDCRGDIAVGVMDKVTQDTDTGTDIKFQITEISDGEISYD